MLDIEDIRTLCKDDTIKATQHFTNRIFKRGIEYDNILQAIMNGEIIEHYPNDYPYPSGLILGYDINHTLLHVVVGKSNDAIYLITAYYPGTDKWEGDYKTRKAVN
jgi:hypothetical protein